MGRGTRFAIVTAVSLAVAALVACVGDDPGAGGNGSDGGDAASGDGATIGDGAATDGSGGDASTCGPCAVACVGSVCPSGAVQLTTWCSSFGDTTNGTDDSVCARLASGDVYCWGANESGQLGVGDTTIRATATHVALDADGNPFSAVEVVMGVSHACARKSDGSIWCWGRNTEGECGNPASTPILTPTRVGTLTGYKHIYAHGYLTCGIDGTGAVTCWGSNDQDALGNSGGNVSTPTLVQDGGIVTSHAAVGDEGACATVVDHVYCWGTDKHSLLGQLGTGSPSPTALQIGDPTGVEYLSGAADVAYGRFNAYAILTSKVVVGWGDNDYHALGAPGGNDQVNPVYFGNVDSGTGLQGIVQISPGLTHTCARTTSGAIYCTGTTGLGEVGPQSAPVSCTEASLSERLNVGTMPCTNLPEPLAPTLGGTPISGALDVAAGCGVTCYVDAAGKVFCLGNDNLGATGHVASETDSSCSWGTVATGLKCTTTPTEVTGLP